MDDRLIGYVRASRWERGSPARRLQAQREDLARAARERGATLVAIEEDVLAGRTLHRPGLQRALAACRRGDAAGIVVTRLDRLSRSLPDLAEIFAEAREHGFAVVALDIGLDTRAVAGDLVATVFAQASHWSRRELVRERAREVLAAAQTRERRRGRPSSTPPELAERIRAMRRSGATLQAICDTLNAECVPTPRGGTHWRPTSLRAVLRPSAVTEPEKT